LFHYVQLRRAILAAALLFMTAYALYLVIAVAQHVNYVAIADNFAPYAFYLDFINGEHPIAGWSLAPVTNIFPDIFLMLSIYSVVGDFGNASVLYYGLKFLLFGVGTFVLCRLIGGDIGRALSCAVCGLFVLTIDARMLSIVEWLDPIRHGGNILMVLLSLVIFLNGLRNGLPKSAYIFIAAATGIGLLGDLLYAPIFLLPMLLVTALLVFKNHLSRWQGLKVLVSALVGVLGFWASIKAITLVGIEVPSKNVGSFSLEKFLYTLETAGSVLTKEFRFSPIMFLCSFLSVGGLSFLAARFVLAKEHDGLHSSHLIHILSCLVVLGFFGDFCAALISTQGFDWDSGIFRFRYVHGGMILLPILALCVVGAARIERTSKAAGFVLAIGAMASAVTGFYLDKDRNIVRFVEQAPRSYDLPYPELAKCVDDFAVSINRKYGLSSFADAKRLTYYSRVGLRVNSLRHTTVIANKYWYVVKEDDGRYRLPEYGFVVSGEETAGRIRARFGEPSRVKLCWRLHGAKVLAMAYDRSTDYELRSLRLPAATAIESNLPAAEYNQDTLF
jgi:hypothetical protein